MKYNHKLEYKQSMLAGKQKTEMNRKRVGSPAKVNPKKPNNLMKGDDASMQEDKHNKETSLDKDEQGTRIIDHEEAKNSHRRAPINEEVWTECNNGVALPCPIKGGCARHRQFWAFKDVRISNEENKQRGRAQEEWTKCNIGVAIPCTVRGGCARHTIPCAFKEERIQDVEEPRNRAQTQTTQPTSTHFQQVGCCH